jgi:glycosyltransferase involved in cell wall biosynthesis
MRDAILLSGWVWEAFNVPERIALALAQVGAKVLYCENPVSFLVRRGRRLEEIFPGVHAYGPGFLGHRFNIIPGMPYVQCQMLARQIIALGTSLRLRRPVFIYPHVPNFTSLCQRMKKLGFFLVHICMDYPEAFQEEQIALADRCLVIPPTVYEELRARHGDKVLLIPQLHYQAGDEPRAAEGVPVLDLLDRIPHPRLVYLGPPADRLDSPLIEALLRAHPEYQLITFGGDPFLPLPNSHMLPWIDWRHLPAVVQRCDVGFMPYERRTPKNLNCVPLKLFDYFCAGLPVVSTPISYLDGMRGLVYVGDSVDSLSIAIDQALAEPTNSPVIGQRKQLARAHSIQANAVDIARAIGLEIDEKSR